MGAVQGTVPTWQPHVPHEGFREGLCAPLIELLKQFVFDFYGNYIVYTKHPWPGAAATSTYIAAVKLRTS